MKKSVPRGPSTAKAIAKLEVGTGITNARETWLNVAREKSKKLEVLETQREIPNEQRTKSKNAKRIKD